MYVCILSVGLRCPIHQNYAYMQMIIYQHIHMYMYMHTYMDVHTHICCYTLKFVYNLCVEYEFIRIPHEKLLGIQRVSNPPTENQQILIPAHSNG